MYRFRNRSCVGMASTLARQIAFVTREAVIVYGANPMDIPIERGVINHSLNPQP